MYILYKSLFFLFVCHACPTYLFLLSKNHLDVHLWYHKSRVKMHGRAARNQKAAIAQKAFK